MTDTPKPKKRYGRHLRGLTDASMKVAVAKGLGGGHADAAQFAGCSIPSVASILQEPQELAFSELMQAVAAYKSISESKEISKSVNNIIKSAKEEVKDLLYRSITVSKRLLTKMEQDDDPSFSDMMQIHQNFTLALSKFEVSEAPKRVQMEGKMTHEYKTVISLEAAESLFKARQSLHVVDVKRIEGATDVLIPDA